MTFGEKLQALRKKQGLSQEQLAEALGVSRQAISKWELNAAVPDVENIVKLSALLHVTTDYLMKADVQEEGDAVMQLRAQVEQLQEELRILSVKKEKRIPLLAICRVFGLSSMQNVCFGLLGGCVYWVWEGLCCGSM